MLVHGISVKVRSEGWWGVGSLPTISDRTSAAPPGQVDWIEVEELESFSAALKWSKPNRKRLVRPEIQDGMSTSQSSPDRLWRSR